jgi:hypothetical protein
MAFKIISIEGKAAATEIIRPYEEKAAQEVMRQEKEVQTAQSLVLRHRD